MELVAIAFMTDNGGTEMLRIRAIRTTIPINCILRTVSFYITEQEIAVFHLPRKHPIGKMTEH